jgi:hypothetical protein
MSEIHYCEDCDALRVHSEATGCVVCGAMPPSPKHVWSATVLLAGIALAALIVAVAVISIWWRMS